ncbi:MAG: hypothetical protein H0V17_22310 [Deltaproteobacteria bacterium]|nr:hypothetical protein [Deltaproteobacteria bacterium]
MGAVLVHIDLDGDRPHPSSLAALAAGRAVASSWGATLYAALVIHDPTDRGTADSTGQISHGHVPGVETVRAALARGGADKVVVAITDAPVSSLWASVGGAWQGVLDHLRPRLVLFGADAPSASEVGPRTGARIGARLLVRARAVGLDHVELRDRDGGYVRANDGGAAVVLVGATKPTHIGDDDIDLVVLAMPGGADNRIEIAGSVPAEVSHGSGTIVAIDDASAGDAQIMGAATRLASLLGASVIRSSATPLAPELCVAIGSLSIDLAGAASLIRIGHPGGKHVDGSIPGLPGPALLELVKTLEDV